MSRTAWTAVFVASLAAFVALVIRVFSGPTPAGAPAGPVVVYCAAGLRVPVEAAAKAYGGDVQLQFGGSQTLLANAEMTTKGDLFIPAYDSYLTMARSKNLLA